MGARHKAALAGLVERNKSAISATMRKIVIQSTMISVSSKTFSVLLVSFSEVSDCIFIIEQFSCLSPFEVKNLQLSCHISLFLL
jgi:hypothetical protein